MRAEDAAGSELLLTLIERRPGWRIIELGELWRYRELLYFLAWRDIKVRYKQTLLGAAWAVVQPLATMVVFSLFLGPMAGLQGKIANYPLFVFAGLLPWTFFANTITAASQSVISSQSLVTKVYFPRFLIPLGATGVGLVDFAVAAALMAAMMVYYGSLPGWGLVPAVLIFLLLVLAALGVGTLLAALTVAYRDFRHVIPFAIQLWMFATPCIYMDATDIIGPGGQRWLPFNPAYGIILNFRYVLLNGLGAIDPYSLVVSGSVSVGLLIAGCLYFRRVERTFADII